MIPLSVFIITLNEADRIAQAIQSVKEIADEIIVIDSGSTDETIAISQSLGAKVITHPWAGYGAQKRFGEEQCQHDWVLNLDADEWLSPDLATEIQRHFQDTSSPKAEGYFLNFIHLFPGETKAPFWCYKQEIIRLYRKSKGRYSLSPVHDRVEMHPGSHLETLRSPLFHRSSRSLSHSIDKLNRYSTMQVDDLYARQISMPPLRLFTEFLLGFFKAYLFRRYCFRGIIGFTYSVLYGFSRFIRIAKYFERKLVK